MKTTSPNYINHIALVLDASASMVFHASQLVRVADAEIAHLAQRSRELDQETRVTVYVFNQGVHCVIYDKDVLRLPSITAYYQPSGMTALVDATVKSQLDLAQTAQLYGDHAFLTYVLTDGQENASVRHSMSELTKLLGDARDNWTVAVLVPDQRGAFEAKRLGFPVDNIAIWDATSKVGVEQAVTTQIRAATETFMTNRAQGIRGSKTIFAAGANQVNRDTVKARTGFRQLSKSEYQLHTVAGDKAGGLDIRTYVTDVTGRAYVTGTAYYELTKPEKIQPQKTIYVRNRRSGRVYQSADARAILNLPDHEVRVKPDANPEFQVFVQSTSVNRKLVPGTKLLVMNQ